MTGTANPTRDFRNRFGKCRLLRRRDRGRRDGRERVRSSATREIRLKPAVPTQTVREALPAGTASGGEKRSDPRLHADRLHE